jgi:NAD-specific glutamate dehydrogenase
VHPAAARAAVERWEEVLRDLRALPGVDLAALTVAVEALETLASAGAAGPGVVSPLEGRR